VNDDVVAVLQRAKERIAADWWQWGQPTSPTSTCAFLAMDHGDALTAALYLEAAIYSRAPRAQYALEVGPAIWTFNDAPERTLVEVLDAFDAAIRLAKTGEAEGTG
jgi:hypothetical protein